MSSPDTDLHPETPDSFGEEGGAEFTLWRHQEESVRNIIEHERNTIVATGTGSGKTFCFLIPILSRCLKRRDQGTDGIGALIIYPMNALANSQYNAFAERLHGTDLRIGLYTGDTDRTEEKARGNYEQRFGRAEPFDSEVISREAMQEDPPDILMTNYQMLEFILTRRRDQALFPREQGALEFLVLDEVHTYSGMQGADVACLMRRLKEHLGVAGDVRCIGTSATIQSGEGKTDTRDEIIDFAQDLFGEPFDDRSIIEESRIPWDPAGRESGELTSDIEITDEDLYRNAESVDEVRPLAEKLTGQSLDHVEHPEELGTVLEDHPVLAFLEDQCQEGPISFRDLVKTYRETYRPDSPLDDCRRELIAGLMLGSVAQETRQGRTRERFVPRLHSFYSQGRTVRGCLSEEGPHLSDRGESICSSCDGDVPAFPVLFCRNCGQEYYSVQFEEDTPEPAPRDAEEHHYYLCPGEWDQQSNPIPDSWHTNNGEVKDTYQDAVPFETAYDPVRNTIGPREETENARAVTAIPAPFQFCIQCAISYTKVPGEFGKLFSIGGVGRSTATDVIVNSTMESLPSEERKSIVFSDNRQDTALQASHLNQLRRWIQFRRALLTAVRREPEEGVYLSEAGHAAQSVLDETGVMQNFEKGDREIGTRPGTERDWIEYLTYVALEDLRKDARSLHQDLEDGGCVRVAFQDLDQFAQNDEFWENVEQLEKASPDLRRDYLLGMLLYMKDNLCVHAGPFLNPNEFDRTRNRLSEDVLFDNEYYRRRWPAYDLDQRNEYGQNVRPKSFTSPSRNTFQAWTKRFWEVDVGPAREIIRDSVERIRTHTEYFRSAPDQSGSLLNPETMRYVPLEEAQHTVCVDCGNVLPFRTTDDCYRMYCRTGGRENDLSDNYFRGEYRKEPEGTVEVRAAEHSGQLTGKERQEIEQQFEDDEDGLNVIVCTPTMELGIDIGDLTAVLMRNVPPKPSNYAQRAGRAGRDLQPAIIHNFCGSGPGRGPHDQYFYRFPQEMISGVIRAPRFHLNNEALIRSHLHSYILERMPGKLPSKIQEILLFEAGDGSHPLPIFEDLRNDLKRDLNQETEGIVTGVLDAFSEEVEAYDWLDEEYIRKTIDQFLPELDRTFDDLREEYRLLQREQEAIHRRQRNVEVEPGDQRRLQAIQARLQNIKKGEGEFYPLKYLGARGFLPNYAFPRRQATLTFSDRSEDMARSDIRALTELGPGNTVYLRGSQYMVSHARQKHSEEEELAYEGYRECSDCGRVYIGDDVRSMTNCDACGASFEYSVSKALSFPNMFGRRTRRITIEEEERARRGYRVAHRYNRQGTTTSLEAGGEESMFRLKYENQGSILAVNQGLRRGDGNDEEGEDEMTGFHLCSRCGKWLLSHNALEKHLDPSGTKYCTSNAASEDVDREVVLYTETVCDVVSVEAEPAEDLEDPEEVESFLWSLAYTLKNAILFEFDLEEWEIGVFVEENTGESTPSIILFESDEGGLGVLQDLTEEDILGDLMERSLQILHGDEPEDACERACYDCLMSFYNQWHHDRLDRTAVVPYIQEVLTMSFGISWTDDEETTWDRYHEEADSDFERKVLDLLKEEGVQPPDEIHKTITNPEGEPVLSADFYYDEGILVMVDGSPHYKDYVQAGDEVKREAVKRLGYEIIALSGSDEEIREKLASLNLS